MWFHILIYSWAANILIKKKSATLIQAHATDPITIRASWMLRMMKTMLFIHPFILNCYGRHLKQALEHSMWTLAQNIICNPFRLFWLCRKLNLLALIEMGENERTNK